jgi:hypothetical protein
MMTAGTFATGSFSFDSPFKRGGQSPPPPLAPGMLAARGFIGQLLVANGAARPSAKELLRHPWLQDENAEQPDQASRPGFRLGGMLSRLWRRKHRVSLRTMGTKVV